MSRLAMPVILLFIFQAFLFAEKDTGFPKSIIPVLVEDPELNYLNQSVISGTSLLPPWNLEGSATEISSGCLLGFQLTTAVPAIKGCIWDTEPLNFGSDDIDYTFQANFGNSDAGADGICLIFKDNGSGCGTGGGGIGSGGLPNTFIVEFDTWDNGPGLGDIPDDHVSVDINGDLTMPISGPVSLGNIEDGLNHEIRFVWSAGSQTYEIYFDGSLKISGVYDIASLFPGGTAYMGFSASTGGAFNNQSVFPGGEVGPPDPPVFTQYDQEVCENEKGVIYTVQQEPGITYTWTVPPGASYTGSGNSISVNFGSESGEVCAIADNDCELSDPVCIYVEVIPLPDIDVNQPDVICDDQFDLQSVILNGLDPSYIVTYYATSNAANAGSPQLPSTVVHTSGTYWVRISTPEACFVVVSIDVEFEVVDIEVIDPKPICEPDYVNLPADVMVNENNGLNISVSYYATQANAINGSPTLSNLNISQSGTYWIRAETSNGCFDVESVNIVVNIKPDIIISLPPIQCLGDTLDLNLLDINDIKGIDPASLSNSFYLSLSDAQQKKNALNPAVIWYDATIWVRTETSEGCFDIKSVNLVFKPASIATISGTNTFCKGSTATITIDFIGQAPFKGSFGNGTNVYTFNTNNKTYTLNVTVDSNQIFKLLTYSDGSSNSCPPVMQGSAILSLFEQADLQTILPAPICKDSSFNIQFVLSKYFPATINLKLNGIDYQHIGDSLSYFNGTLSSGAQLIIASITDKNSCTYILNDTLDVSVQQAPSISNLKEICNNTEFIVSFDISGGDPSSYTVNGSTAGIIGNSFTSSLLPNKTNYSFSVDDGNGCGPTIVSGFKDCSCETDAGTMNLNPLDFCIDLADTAIHNKDQFLDANDNLLFVLHKGSASLLVNIIAINSVPYFPFNPVTMMPETVYFISAVAGNGAGPGMIDLNDPCLSVANGTPVTYHALPELTANDVTICEGDSAMINLSLTGNPPFSITVKKDGVIKTSFQTNNFIYNYQDNPSKDAVYSFTFSDEYCSGAIPINAKVIVRKKLLISNVVHICSADKQTYTLNFNISGGDPSSYAVTGLNGSVVGSSFTSETILSGQPYIITLSDNSGCKSLDLSGSFTCSCETDAGNITWPKHACVGDTLIFNSNSFLLDANDTIIYVITDSSLLDFSKILAAQSSPIVWFDSSYMVTGLNGYYIYTIVGNKTSTGYGVDFSDPCLDISKGTVFNFHNIPEFYFKTDTFIECGKFELNINIGTDNPIYDSEIDKYWTTINGNFVTIDTFSGGILAIVDKNATYNLKLVNVYAGCSFNKDIIVDIKTEDPIIKLDHNEEIGCQINEIYLNASGSSFGPTYKVNWSTNSGNIISGNDQLEPLIDKSGTYYLEITDTNSGCISKDSVIVTQIPELTINNIYLQDPSCAGKLDGSISISNIVGGVPPYQYSFNGISSNNPSFAKLESGTYDLNISDVFGCVFDTVLILNAPPPINIELGNDITVEWGTIVNLNAELSLPLNQLDTLIWFNIDSASCEFCLQPSFIATQNTLVKAIAINNSCEDEDEIRVIVEKIHDVYIPNSFSPNADGINDKLVIFGGKNVVSVRKFEIFNRWGGRVHIAENFYPDGSQGGWNGKLGDQYLNEAVFVYYAVIEFTDGDIEVFKGDVNLIR